MAKLITVSENLLEDILPHLKGNSSGFNKCLSLRGGSLRPTCATTRHFEEASPLGGKWEVPLGWQSSIEIARLGMAQVVVYQHKKPFIYQEQLLKVQEEAKQKKLGMWNS